MINITRRRRGVGDFGAMIQVSRLTYLLT